MAGNLRVFLDSNVILSGLLSPKGAPKILLDLLSIEVPLLQGMTGEYNLDEIERNLRKRFSHLLPIYREGLAKMRLEIIEVPPYKAIASFLGKMSLNDIPVLVSAQTGRADYLVTGNRKDFPKEVSKPVQIISPSEFLEKILPEKIRE